MWLNLVQVSSIECDFPRDGVDRFKTAADSSIGCSINNKWTIHQRFDFKICKRLRVYRKNIFCYFPNIFHYFFYILVDFNTGSIEKSWNGTDKMSHHTFSDFWMGESFIGSLGVIFNGFILYLFIVEYGTLVKVVNIMIW